MDALPLNEISSQQPSSGNLNRTLLIGGIGCAVLVILLCTIGVIYLVVSGGPPRDVVIEVNSPTQMAVGNSFTIVISVTNTGNKEQLLEDINLETSYLEGIFISGSTPPYYDSFVGMATGDQNYKFKTPIAAGETLDIVFDATAVQVGDYAGNLEVCVGNASSCQQYSVRTVVAQQ